MDALKTSALGLTFGVALHRIGFSSWDEVHRMFTFVDLRLTLTFATAVVLLFVSWRVIARVQRATWADRRIHKGSVPGALLFGAGWALTGACPAIALVQVGEGKPSALFTLTGILAGNWLFTVLQARWLRWDTQSCNDD